MIESLEFAVRVARELGDPMPHLLLQGPGGVGKTSLARAIANELDPHSLDRGFHVLLAPLVTDFGTLLRVLTSLRRDGEVLFIDEIHRLPVRVAEALYQAIDDGTLSIPVVCGQEERTLHVRLPRFTLVGATTEEELLPAPLRSRFGLSRRLDFYSRTEIAELLDHAAARAGLEIRPDARRLLIGAARDTPREALELFRSVRDQARLESASTVDLAAVRRVLERQGLDGRGLRPLERRCLETLAGGPLGSRTLAGRLGIPVRKLLAVVEPYLLRHGLITITRWGRATTGAA